MKVIVTGDPHISEEVIPELRAIFGEILEQEADMFINLGDWFDKCRPTPAELKFGAEIVAKLKKQFKKVIILSGTGRHNWLNDVSVIEFFEFMKITPVGIKHEIEIDGKKCLFGHFFTNKSTMEYGTAEYTLSQLKKYDIVLLGHQHLHQRITDKIYHVGSMRYVGWNEVGDLKQIAIIEDGKLEFTLLKNPIIMKDVYAPEQLLSIDHNTKVRMVITKWEDYKKWVNDFPKWEKKFKEFKVKTDYQTIVKICKGSTQDLTKGLKGFVAQWLRKIKEKEVLTFLKERFIEEGL
ncbi:MAG: metallophosphoesterase [Fusobacteriaceae bacterium]|nr:metallophosphoesterase [Fusobacteriaceae bacterium]